MFRKLKKCSQYERVMLEFKIANGSIPWIVSSVVLPLVEVEGSVPDWLAVVSSLMVSTFWWKADSNLSQFSGLFVFFAFLVVEKADDLLQYTGTENLPWQLIKKKLQIYLRTYTSGHHIQSLSQFFDLSIIVHIVNKHNILNFLKAT